MSSSDCFSASDSSFWRRLSPRNFTWVSEGKPGNYTNQLFRNLGNGRFEEVTSKAGVGHPGYGMGMSVGDFNNDGYPDIYVTNYGPNVLYKNNGDGTFKDVSENATVTGNACSVGAVWLDFDNDGHLDLYVGNYIQFDPDYEAKLF